jgi:hypothetical protein
MKKSELRQIIKEEIFKIRTLNESIRIPLDLELSYKKWIESTKPDFFGADNSEELRSKHFLKLLNGYSDSESRKQFIDGLSIKYGELPYLLKQIRRHYN